jgi:ferredoxin-NADP reductase
VTAMATRSLPPQRRNAPEQDVAVVVDETQMAADRVVALTLRRPGNQDLPAWDPGAHVDLHLGPDLVRQYSQCGDPAERDQ